MNHFLNTNYKIPSMTAKYLQNLSWAVQNLFNIPFMPTGSNFHNLGIKSILALNQLGLSE
jgi:hypothetical protein